MTRKETLEKARLERQPKLIFDSARYSIREVTFNFQIYIKLPRKSDYQAIDRHCYSLPEHGVQFAHETAEEMISKYFTDSIQSKLN